MRACRGEQRRGAQRRAPRDAARRRSSSRLEPRHHDDVGALQRAPRLAQPPGRQQRDRRPTGRRRRAARRRGRARAASARSRRRPAPACARRGARAASASVTLRRPRRRARAPSAARVEQLLVAVARRTRMVATAHHRRVDARAARARRARWSVSVVLPVPPTVRLPMLTTRAGTRAACQQPRAYARRRASHARAVQRGAAVAQPRRITRRPQLPLPAARVTRAPRAPRSVPHDLDDRASPAPRVRRATTRVATARPRARSGVRDDPTPPPRLRARARLDAATRDAGP